MFWRDRFLLVVSLAGGLLAGCDDEHEHCMVDASPTFRSSCNPVTQNGCPAGDKCTWIVTMTSPAAARADCVREGDVDLEGACVDTWIVDGASDACGDANVFDRTLVGTDDCKAGGICLDGVCTQICQGDMCGPEEACVAREGLFGAFEDVGVCTSTCDPLLQDCGEGLGCYVDPFPGHGYAICEPEVHPDRMQGDTCPRDECTVSGCAAGYGPWLGTPYETWCTAFSGAVDTYLDDLDGDGVGTLVGNPLGAPGFDCSEERIGVAGHQSYFLQSFYGNTSDTPADWGICAPSGIENGDCAQFSVGFLFATYDAAEADPDPPTGRQALDELCETTERCGYGCVSNATYEELVSDYCDGHVSSPACNR